jgi:hypothetical protein
MLKAGPQALTEVYHDGLSKGESWRVAFGDALKRLPGTAKQLQLTGQIAEPGGLCRPGSAAPKRIPIDLKRFF